MNDWSFNVYDSIRKLEIYGIRSNAISVINSVVVFEIGKQYKEIQNSKITEILISQPCGYLSASQSCVQIKYTLEGFEDKIRFVHNSVFVAELL